MKTCAIIPARGGSKGVPKKNILLIEGYPLIAYSIAAARLTKIIDRVVVSTDSEEVAALAREYGAEAPFLRPSEFSRDDSPDREFLLHAIDWFEQHENESPEYWVHLRPTTPLREPSLITQAIEAFLLRSDATSLRSAHACPESPFKWFLLKEDGFFTGLQNSDMDLLNQPRQQFPTVYIPDGYVDVLRTDIVKSSKGIHGDKILGFVSPYCIEVDTAEDFKLLEYESKRNRSAIFDYLSREFPLKGN